MPSHDAEWKTAYTAVATELSATPGSSSGTPVDIDTRGAVAVEFRLYSVTLPAATKIYIGLEELDGASTALAKTVLRRNGSRARFPVAAANDGTAPYPCRSNGLRVVPWLDATDAGAACVIQYRRIGPNRI